MSSHRPRTSSKFGKSGKSMNRGSSPKGGNSSATAPRSFEQVFGTTEPRELQNLKDTLQVTRTKLATLEKGMPQLALYRVKHRQRISRLKKYARDLTEAINSMKGA